MADEVARWLGRMPTSTDSGVATARAEVHEAPHGFTLTFTLRSVSGELHERLSAHACETLADVVALKLAVAMDTTAVVESAPPATPPQTAAPSREWGALTVAGIELGTLPRLSSVLGVGLSLSRSPWRAELALRYGVSKVFHRTYEDVGARLDLLAGDLRGCVVPVLARLSIPLCLGLELGVLRGRGLGVRPATSNQWWPGVSVGSALYWPVLPHLSLMTALESVFVLSRPSYRIENLGSVYQAPPLVARGLVGLEARWR